MASLTIKRTTTLAALLVGAVAPALMLMPLASRAASAACSPTSLAGPPEVVTGGDHVAGTSDELEGTINPCKLATTYYFEYGPTNEYSSGRTAEGHLKSELAEPENVSETVTGMQPGWRYRLVATNADNTTGVFGKEHEFTAKASKKESKTKSAFKLSQPLEPTPVGEPLELSGTLTGSGNANREVVLQASPYPYRTDFADVGPPILTNVEGGFSFRVPDLSTSTRFRVATIGGPSLISNIVTGMAAVRVLLKARTDSHEVGFVRLYGTVSPAEVGARVYFQLEKAPKQKAPTGKLEKPGKAEKAEEKPPTFASKFSTVVKRATKRISRFSLVVRIQDAGPYRAFVALQPGPLVSGHSQTLTLRAAPAKHKKKT